MRVLGLAAASLLAMGSPAIAAMPTPPATSAKVAELGWIVENMHGNSRIVDQRIADMLRPFASTEGIAIPAIAPPYTQLPASAAKLRPGGWKISITERDDGSVLAIVRKPTPDGLDSGHIMDARNSSTTDPGALALTAAMLFSWAQDMREAGQ